MVTLSKSQIVARVGITTAHRDRTGLSQMQTTGSISSGSNTLTVTDAKEFRAGDWVIVETGGEAGAGERGTKGVGGAWPARSYANATAMNADTSQANNALCWLEDTGRVYFFNGSTWNIHNSYYISHAIPKALTAQITDVSGNTITLDRNASADTTGANVYFDNWGILQDYADALGETVEINMPAGTYAISSYIYVNNRPGITISGAGKEQTILKCPYGAAHGGFYIANSDNALLKDFQVFHSLSDTRYSMIWSDSRVSETDATILWPEINQNLTAYGDSFVLYRSDGAEIRDCKSVNPFARGFLSQESSNSIARRVTVTRTVPLRVYLQWSFQFVDQVGGLAEDCEIDSDWLWSGFEAFKSRDITFDGCSGRNIYCANNSSDATAFNELDVLIEDASGGVTHRAAESTALLEFTTNVPGGYRTNMSYITNPNIIQQGVPKDLQNQRVNCISVTSDDGCPVSISGTYDTDLVTPKGLIDIQGAPIVGDANGYGIISAGTVTVEGIRIKGTAPGTGNSTIRRDAGVLSVTNSIFDPSTPTGGSNGGTLSGNQTNAEYEA